MSPKGRPEGEYRRAQPAGSSMSPKGRPEGWVRDWLVAATLMLVFSLPGQVRADNPALAQRLPTWARALIGSEPTPQTMTDTSRQRAIWINESTMPPSAVARQIIPHGNEPSNRLLRYDRQPDWEIVSGWFDGALVTVQWRARGEGSLIVTSLLEARGLRHSGKVPGGVVPTWLDFLPNPWSQRIRLDGVWMTTVAARSPQALTSVHQQLVANARLNGLIPTASSESSGGRRDGPGDDARIASPHDFTDVSTERPRWLVLQGLEREAIITLVGHLQGTEVVVHLRERMP